MKLTLMQTAQYAGVARPDSSDTGTKAGAILNLGDEMSDLSHVIEALRGATSELKAANDSASIVVKKRTPKPKVKPKPCHCNAWKFPHRRANYCVDVPETVYYVDNVNEKAMLEAGHKWSDF
jgi:hypothetical protein